MHRRRRARWMTSTPAGTTSSRAPASLTLRTRSSGAPWPTANAFGFVSKAAIPTMASSRKEAVPVASALPWTHGEPTSQTISEPSPVPPATRRSPKARRSTATQTPSPAASTVAPTRTAVIRSESGSRRKSPTGQGPAYWARLRDLIRLPISVSLVSGPGRGRKTSRRRRRSEARPARCLPRPPGHAARRSCPVR